MPVTHGRSLKHSFLRTTRVRVAILGAGLMGRWHAHCARQCGATIQAIVDLHSDAARTLSRLCGRAPVFATLDACLRVVEVDAVYVCTDVASHGELVSEALHGGKHVLVEKPVTDGYAGTLQLTKLAENVGRVLTCAHQFLFQRGFSQAREALERIGPPLAVTFTAFTAGAERRDEIGRRKVLLEILPHPVSLFQSIFGVELGTSQWNVLRFTSEELHLNGLIGKTDTDIRISLRRRPTRNELAIVYPGGTARVNLYHGFAVHESGRVSRTAKILQPFHFGGAVC